MAIYECMACGSTFQCPPANHEYEAWNWEFWCSGDDVAHGGKLKIEKFKKDFSPSHYNHPPLRMICRNRNSHLFTKGKK